jgi:hypothetical protein
MILHAPLGLLAGLFVLSIATASPVAQVGGDDAAPTPVAAPMTIAFLR